jgi:hypothetical protein
VRRLAADVACKQEDVVKHQDINAAGICLASLLVKRNFADVLGPAEVVAILALEVRIC